MFETAAHSRPSHNSLIPPTRATHWRPAKALSALRGGCVHLDVCRQRPDKATATSGTQC